MDALDHRILNLIQDDAGIGVAEMAERCHSSAATCARRLVRLRQQGVICKEVALIAPAWSPTPLAVWIEVTLERQGAQRQNEFQSRMERLREVSQCYMVAGESDYVLCAHFTDMDACKRFIEKRLDGDPNVRKFRSLFVIEQTKFETASTFPIT